MKHGAHRAGLGLALTGVLALAFAALAGGAVKTKTFSSGDLDKVIADAEPVNQPVTTSQTITIKKKRSKVKDVNVGIRVSHPFDADLDISIAAPNGREVELTSDNPAVGDGAPADDFGSGSTDCNGALTVFDDSAATSITDGTKPYAGSFQPEGTLADLKGSKLKGAWRLDIADDDDDTFEGTLHCVELEIKYKKKKKHHH